MNQQREVQRGVTDLSVQVRGSSGYISREVPVERIYRDVPLFRLYEAIST